MKQNWIFVFLLVFEVGFSQQYDSVIIENDSIDSNNQVYKCGNVFIFDYEIIEKGISYKLNKNTQTEFELIPATSDSINIDKIHLIVKPVSDIDRTNENQTQISYLQGPLFNSYTSTGAVENIENVWIHPIRDGFFKSLETCPFPFIKCPIETGLEWSDAMVIGELYSNEKWGKWEGMLLLNYIYKITGKENIETKIGEIECYIIESTATSNMGQTSLKSYFSGKYGFIRLEYNLLTDIKVNMWIVDFKENKEFNDIPTFFRTKEYLK